MKLLNKIDKEALLKNRKQIIIFGVLSLGLLAALILVQNYQNLKSRADSTPLTIFDQTGKEIDLGSGNTYQVKKGPIQIRLNAP